MITVSRTIDSGSPSGLNRVIAGCPFTVRNRLVIPEPGSYSGLPFVSVTVAVPSSPTNVKDL